MEKCLASTMPFSTACVMQDGLNALTFYRPTGGAYILIAASLDEAKQFAFKDPLHTQGCSQLDVFEWNAD